MNKIYLLNYIFLSLLFFACIGESNQTSNDASANNIEENEIISPKIKLLSERIESDTSNAELYFARANAYLIERNIQGASGDILKAMQKDSSQAKYYLTASDILLQSGNGSAAIKILQNGLGRLPENTTIWLERAKLHYYMRQYDEAILSFSKLLKIDKTMPEAYFFRGLMRKEMKETDRAIKDFETAIEHNPDFYDALMQLGLIYSETDSKLSIAYLDNALRLDPQSTEALYAKALIFQNGNKLNESIKAYNQIVALDKQNVNAYYNLGVIYFNKDSLSKAIKYFDMASAIEPTYYRAYYMKGIYWEQTKNFEKAKAEFQNALSINPDHELSKEGLNRVKQ